MVGAEISRRKFLGLFSAVPLLPVAAMAWEFVTTQGRIRQDRKIAVGTLAGLSQGTTVIKEHGIAIVRSGSDLTALSLACTHLGCTIAAAGEGFACPCHGSRFDRDGSVIEGPALRPLARYELEITEDQRVLVNVGAKADAA